MSNAWKKLKFDGFPTMDGGYLKETMDAALNQIRLDCKDRPTLAKPRSVTLTVKMVPKADEQGNLHDVLMQCSVKPSVPVSNMPVVRMRASGGDLLYSEDSPDNPDQMSLFAGSDEEAQVVEEQTHAS